MAARKHPGGVLHTLEEPRPAEDAAVALVARRHPGGVLHNLEEPPLAEDAAVWLPGNNLVVCFTPWRSLIQLKLYGC